MQSTRDPKTVFRAVFLSVCYGILSILVIAAVRLAGGRSPEQLPVGEVFLPWQMLVFLVGGALVAGLLIRKVNARTAWELILGGTLFLGAWFYLWVACSGEIGLLAASLLVLLQALVRRVWTHDLFILIGVSGVALNFAFLFPAHTVLILLVGLAVYDTFSGRPGGLAARFAASLVHRGVIPGLIIPERLAQLQMSTEHAVRQPGAVFLGVGDLILPLILVARASGAGLMQAGVVAVGMLIAVIWLGLRDSTKPFPALVPLAIGTGIPYLALLLLHFV